MNTNILYLVISDTNLIFLPFPQGTIIELFPRSHILVNMADLYIQIEHLAGSSVYNMPLNPSYIWNLQSYRYNEEQTPLLKPSSEDNAGKYEKKTHLL